MALNEGRLDYTKASERLQTLFARGVGLFKALCNFAGRSL
jgi:hypothetical protein